MDISKLSVTFDIEKWLPSFISEYTDFIQKCREMGVPIDLMEEATSDMIGKAVTYAVNVKY